MRRDENDRKQARAAKRERDKRDKYKHERLGHDRKYRKAA